MHSFPVCAGSPLNHLPNAPPRCKQGVSDALTSASALLPAAAGASSAASSGVAEVQRLMAELLSSRQLQQIAAALGIGACGDSGGRGHGSAGTALGAPGSTAGGSAVAGAQHGPSAEGAVLSAEQQQGQVDARGEERQAEQQAQAALVQQWVRQVSARLLPYVGSVSDADLRRAADAAVASLSDALSASLTKLPALSQMLPPLPGLPFGAAQQAPSGDRRPLDGQGIDLPPQQHQQQQQQQEAAGSFTDLLSLAGWRELRWWDGDAPAAAAPSSPGGAVASTTSSSGGCPAAAGAAAAAVATLEAAQEEGEPISLYPPGRILFLRVAPAKPSLAAGGGPIADSGSSKPSRPAEAAALEAPAAAAAAAQGEPLSDAEAAGSPEDAPLEEPTHRVELLEVGRSNLESEAFDRIILHERMLSDHRTRAYRSALLKVLKGLPPAGAA
jgi:hypothetical protein